MTIQRWEIRNGFRGEDAYKHEDGPYVWYTDHQATVARYEARLAEDAKVRAQFFHALDNLYAMVNGECPSLLENDHHDDMVRAALAAAKEVE